MQTTLKEQIEVVALARKIINEHPEILDGLTIYSNLFLDKCLNDAASTLAAVQLAPCPEWIDIQVKKDNLI